jgi:hypothetical protein
MLEQLAKSGDTSHITPVRSLDKIVQKTRSKNGNYNHFYSELLLGVGLLIQDGG